MAEFLELVFYKVNSGGVVMWLLLILSAVLWGLISKYQFLLDVENKDGYIGDLSKYLDLVVIKDKSEIESIIYDKISFDAILIKALIMTAPLMGLLGTVGGMIETFSSLETMEMFKSNGGIAGGISQALLTTQLGLIVAVPGIFYVKVLEKKKSKLMTFFKRKIYS